MHHGNQCIRPYLDSAMVAYSMEASVTDRTCPDYGHLHSREQCRQPNLPPNCVPDTVMRGAVKSVRVPSRTPCGLSASRVPPVFQLRDLSQILRATSLIA